MECKFTCLGKDKFIESINVSILELFCFFSKNIIKIQVSINHKNAICLHLAYKLIKIHSKSNDLRHEFVIVSMLCTSYYSGLNEMTNAF